MSVHPGCLFLDFNPEKLALLFDPSSEPHYFGRLEPLLDDCWLHEWRPDETEDYGYRCIRESFSLSQADFHQALKSPELMLEISCRFFGKIQDSCVMNLLGPLPHVRIDWPDYEVRPWSHEQRLEFQLFLQFLGNLLESRYIVYYGDTTPLDFFRFEAGRLEPDLGLIAPGFLRTLACIWVNEALGALPPATFPMVPIPDPFGRVRGSYMRYEVPELDRELYRDQGLPEPDSNRVRIPYLETTPVPLSVPLRHPLRDKAVQALETLINGGFEDESEFWEHFPGEHDVPDFTMFRDELELIMAINQAFLQAIDQPQPEGMNRLWLWIKERYARFRAEASYPHLEPFQRQALNEAEHL